MGKDGKKVTVIKIFFHSGKFTYILSDYIQPLGQSNSEVGWIISDDPIEEGEYSALCCFGYDSLYKNNVFYCAIYIAGNNTAEIYKEIITGHKLLTAANARIKELEADLELYKSTKAFIDECKSSFG